MPPNKDLKRLVRARMKKTGEAYTAALSHIKTPKTPCGFLRCTRWYKRRDTQGKDGVLVGTLGTRARLPWRPADVASRHRRAREYEIQDRWMVVADCHGRLRAHQGVARAGQRRDGTYEASKSRTFNVPVKKSVRCLGKRERSPTLAEWREREGTHRHRAEINAARLDRPQHHRGRIRRERQVEEHGRSAAHETSRPRDSGPSQAVLVGSPGHARRSIVGTSQPKTGDVSGLAGIGDAQTTAAELQLMNRGLYVVMGVSGSGKSLIGAAFARRARRRLRRRRSIPLR